MMNDGPELIHHAPAAPAHPDFSCWIRSCQSRDKAWLIPFMQHLSPFSHHLQSLFMAQLNNFTSPRSSIAQFGQDKELSPGHAQSLLPSHLERSLLSPALRDTAVDDKATKHLRLMPKNKADNLHLQMDCSLFSVEVKLHKEFLSSSPKLFHSTWQQRGLMTRAPVPQGDQTPSRAEGWLGQRCRDPSGSPQECTSSRGTSTFTSRCLSQHQDRPSPILLQMPLSIQNEFLKCSAKQAKSQIAL